MQSIAQTGVDKTTPRNDTTMDDLPIKQQLGTQFSAREFVVATLLPSSVVCQLSPCLAQYSVPRALQQPPQALPTDALFFPESPRPLAGARPSSDDQGAAALEDVDSPEGSYGFRELDEIMSVPWYADGTCRGAGAGSSW